MDKLRVAIVVSLEMSSGKRTLPVWHNVNKEDLLSFSPYLADKFVVSSACGIEKVALEIARGVRPDIYEYLIRGNVYERLLVDLPEEL